MKDCVQELFLQETFSLKYVPISSVDCGVDSQKYSELQEPYLPVMMLYQIE